MTAKSGWKVAGKPVNPFSKNDPRYCEKVVYLPKKTLDDGRTCESKIYHVRIQHRKIRIDEIQSAQVIAQEFGEEPLSLATHLNL